MKSGPVAHSRALPSKNIDLDGKRELIMLHSRSYKHIEAGVIIC
jgi:hypothetical protein